MFRSACQRLTLGHEFGSSFLVILHPVEFLLNILGINVGLSLVDLHQAFCVFVLSPGSMEIPFALQFEFDIALKVFQFHLIKLIMNVRNTMASSLILEDHFKKLAGKENNKIQVAKLDTKVPRMQHSPFGDFPKDYGVKKGGATAEPKVPVEQPGLAVTGK